jgi:hypothetical protein
MDTPFVETRRFSMIMTFSMWMIALTPRKTKSADRVLSVWKMGEY